MILPSGIWVPARFISICKLDGRFSENKGFLVDKSAHIKYDKSIMFRPHKRNWELVVIKVKWTPYYSRNDFLTKVKCLAGWQSGDVSCRHASSIPYKQNLSLENHTEYQPSNRPSNLNSCMYRISPNLFSPDELLDNPLKVKVIIARENEAGGWHPLMQRLRVGTTKITTWCNYWRVAQAVFYVNTRKFCPLNRNPMWSPSWEDPRPSSFPTWVLITKTERKRVGYHEIPLLFEISISSLWFGQFICLPQDLERIKRRRAVPRPWMLSRTGY